MSKYKVTVYQVQAHKRRPTLQLDHLQIGVGKSKLRLIATDQLYATLSLFLQYYIKV